MSIKRLSAAAALFASLGAIAESSVFKLSAVGDSLVDGVIGGRLRPANGNRLRPNPARHFPRMVTAPIHEIQSWNEQVVRAKRAKKIEKLARRRDAMFQLLDEGPTSRDPRAAIKQRMYELAQAPKPAEPAEEFKSTAPLLTPDAY